MLESLSGAAAWVLKRVPRPVRDLAYDAVARVRHRLFAKPAGACPILSRELRSRFDD